MISYKNIDLHRTGALIEHMIKESDFSVKNIQDYLHLSCPQPIYRWFKGQILPSVDHLFMLSKLLGVHMEELLVAEQLNEKQILTFVGMVYWNNQDLLKRLTGYYEKIETVGV